MERLDVFLVEKNYFSSRSKASYEIKQGNVEVNGKVVLKPSFHVLETDSIHIKENTLKYVSRGGLKLEKAISTFHLDLKNKIMLDIGSSTGGFCDCALQNGIGYIYAVDVGKDQFTKKLLESNKISLYENTDIKDFKGEDKNISLVTMDVSFVSVTKLLFVLRKMPTVKEVICLIKPQFECGKEVADRYKGIPLNKKVHYAVIEKVISTFHQEHFYLQGLTFSPIKGGSGNIEYLAYLTRKKEEKNIDYALVIDLAFSSF